MQFITQNTARFGGGNYLKIRYWDAINPAPEKEADDRTPEEVVSHMLGKLKKMGGESK